MFTGLVEDLGEIVAAQPLGQGRRLTIRTAIPDGGIAVGDSVAVDGACLTAERIEGDRFQATASRETLTRTTLGEARPGRRVHLERALRLGDRLGGHLVQGHVDAVGLVVRAADEAESRAIDVRLGDGLSRYVATKGSVCVDGVSLTVVGIDGDVFRVNVVPHTASVTRLGAIAGGARVNVEVDILAKYVERLIGGAQSGTGLTLERLQALGYR